MTTTEDKNFGIQLEETMIQDLVFADDIALMDDNVDMSQDFLDCVCKTAAMTGLEINTSKTKVLAFHDKAVNITCKNSILENVPYFPYLGSNITADLDIDPEIRSRIAKATGNASRLKNFWHKKGVSTNTKIKLYMACIRSTLLYGCESWALNKRHISALDSFEVRCARKFIPRSHLKSTSTIRTEAILGPSLESVIRTRRLKWCGHVLRMDENRFPKAALIFHKHSSWRRPPGGQKTSWRKVVADDLEAYLKPYGMKSNIWVEKWPSLVEDVANDRKRWKAVIRDITGAGNGH